MNFILSHLPYVAAGIAVTVAVLKYTAPLTKSKVDDEVLAVLEKAAPYVTADELTKLKSALGV